MTLWKIAAFVVVTAILGYVSRASLRSYRSHGFYRFFAWETMTALILLNVDFWLQKPFAWNQIISWTLLFASIVPLVFGVRALLKKGGPKKARPDSPHLLAFERTTQLVTSGVYRYIRHPLYSSLLLLAWGAFFKHISWIGGGLVGVATLFLFLTARADEAECILFFGEEYKSYMQRSRRFIPWLF
jgi:protein-S-isoprenylcysteine O-methyltransferase Ste14